MLAHLVLVIRTARRMVFVVVLLPLVPGGAWRGVTVTGACLVSSHESTSKRLAESKRGPSPDPRGNEVRGPNPLLRAGWGGKEKNPLRSESYIKKTKKK